MSTPATGQTNAGPETRPEAKPEVLLDDLGIEIPDDADVYQEGDIISVDVDGSSAVASDTSETRAGPGGYALIHPGVGIRSTYTVRFDTTLTGWQDIDEETEIVLDGLEYITGARLTTGALDHDRPLTTGEIAAFVVDTPCGDPSFIGCAVNWVDGGRIDRGAIFICRCIARGPELAATLRHELAHVLNLAHYSGDFGGGPQLMNYSYIAGLKDYRSGDVNGLRKVTALGFGGGTAPTHPPGRVRIPSAAGSGLHVKASWSAAIAYGLSIDKHQVEVQNTTNGRTKSETTGPERSASVLVTGDARYRVRVRPHNGKGWGEWSSWSPTTAVEGRCIPSVTDVPESSPFCEEITWLLDEDIATGFADGSFRPGDTVTRQAMAAFLMRSAERVVPGSTEGDWSGPSGFRDVPSDHAFHDEITWLASTGITDGYPDGTFKPGRAVTREAVVVMLKGLWEHLLPGSTAGDWSGFAFADVPSDHPFHDEITWLASTGALEGFPDGTFRPADPISRQGLASFLFRSRDLYITP